MSCQPPPLACCSSYMLVSHTSRTDAKRLDMYRVDRHDVNREDWETIDAWLDAVVAALPDLPLKTVSELGGAPLSLCSCST